MAEQKERETLELARQISGYLDRHPNAADTLEGITRWWLKRDGGDANRDGVAFHTFDG